MTRTFPEVQDRLLAAHGQGRRLALLFDYDGTLTAIVERPSLAQLDSQTAEILVRMARRPRLSVGILSGRRIDELEQMVGLPGIYYAGTSGLELNLLGTRHVHPQMEEGRILVETVRPVVEEIAAGFYGARIEVKPLGLTLHFRSVAPGQVELLRRQAREALARYAERLRILDGPLALEITPALGWTKGTAVGTMVEHSGPGTLPLYAGDEANDADALEAANRLGGVSIGVGPHAPAAARHRLPSPAALTGFLAELAAVLH